MPSQYVENRFIPSIRKEVVKYPKKASRDKNIEEIARLVYQYPGRARLVYSEGIRAGGINRRIFYYNVDLAIRCGIIFMVNWKLYPSPEFDFVKWESKVLHY